MPVSSQRPKTICQPIRVPALSRAPPTLWAAFLRVAPSLQRGRCTIEDGQIGRWPSPKKWLCCKLIVEVFFKLSYEESLSLKRQRPVAWDEPRLGSRSSVSVSFLERPHLGQHCHQSRSLSPDTTRLLLRTIGAKVSTPLPPLSHPFSFPAPESSLGLWSVESGRAASRGLPLEYQMRRQPCHPHSPPGSLFNPLAT